MPDGPAGATARTRERLHEDRYVVSDVNALRRIGQYPDHEANPVGIVLPGPECLGERVYRRSHGGAGDDQRMLIEIARLIEEGFSADAGTPMERTVLTRIRNNIGEYGATPSQRTLLAMMDPVGRMVERPEAASG